MQETTKMVTIPFFRFDIATFCGRWGHLTFSHWRDVSPCSPRYLLSPIQEIELTSCRLYHAQRDNKDIFYLFGPRGDGHAAHVISLPPPVSGTSPSIPVSRVVTRPGVVSQYRIMPLGLLEGMIYQGCMRVIRWAAWRKN